MDFYQIKKEFEKIGYLKNVEVESDTKGDFIRVKGYHKGVIWIPPKVRKQYTPYAFFINRFLLKGKVKIDLEKNSSYWKRKRG